MLVIDDHVWIANTGDSRAVMSAQNGTQYKSLTEDHKPSEEAERVRIIKAGGEVYQNNNIMLGGPGGPVTQGPVRVLPGRLSVSRTFGDCQAKMEKYNGNPNVIIVDPEVFHVDISNDNNDFILLACDGIFDRLNTEQACQEIWGSIASFLREADQKLLGKNEKNTP